MYALSRIVDKPPWKTYSNNLNSRKCFLLRPSNKYALLSSRNVPKISFSSPLLSSEE
jgi:hypothetical protein